jgi:hypothetical protein
LRFLISLNISKVFLINKLKYSETMKPNQFAIALISAVTITGGALISGIGIAQACPLKGIFNSSSSPNTIKAIKIVGGTSVLGGSILGGLYLYRRQNQASKLADIGIRFDF